MKTNYSSCLAFIFSAIALLTFVSCSFVFYSCKKSNPVSPPPAEPDSTSNDFVWAKTPIGTYGTMLQDIAAFSDTDVWICGEIHFKDTDTHDSLGRMILPYNAAHWNGKDWEYIRINWCGLSEQGFFNATAMLALKPDDIWFSDGIALSHWNGKTFTHWCIPNDQIPGGISSIFKNGNTIYLGGVQGSLTTFDGTSFRKLDVGTKNIFYDAWTVGTKTICAVSNWPHGENEPPMLLMIQNGFVSKWIDSAITPGMHGVWFDEMDNILVCGPKLRRWKDGAWREEKDQATGFLMDIRGLTWYDIFMVGQIGTIEHYNGKYWHLFDAVDQSKIYDFNRLTYVKDNVFILGFSENGQNTVFQGQRIKRR